MPGLSTEPHIAIQPLDERRRKFVVDRPVYGSSARRFRRGDAADGSPVAQAVLGVPGVTEVTVSGNELTVVTDGSAPWNEVEPEVRYAVSVALSSAGPSRPEVDVTGDDAIYGVVDQIFREEINPMVARHGGRVELVDVQEATVVVRMRGGCQGCGMATVTLRQGIETALRQAVPAVRGIRDITDHSAGTKPYFKSA